MTTTSDEIYYDPYDFGIDADPYPIFKRMRDEVPLYRNEALGFYAVSRFADVESCSIDWQTYSSGRGTMLEIIQSGMEVPKGMFIFEDPPLHNIHRRLMGRVFTPRRVALLEDRMREYCAAVLDPLVGSGGFDYVRDLGADLPMRVIGNMLGIPEEDQVAVRDRFDDSLRIDGRRQIPKVVVDVRNDRNVHRAILRSVVTEPRPCYPAAAMLPPAAVRERFPLEIPHASKRPFPPASLDTSARKRRRLKRVARSK